MSFDPLGSSQPLQPPWSPIQNGLLPTHAQRNSCSFFSASQTCHVSLLETLGFWPHFQQGEHLCPQKYFDTLLFATN